MQKKNEQLIEYVADSDAIMTKGIIALLIRVLCGDDEQKWKEVEETAILCLKARKKLWDLILENIN